MTDAVYQQLADVLDAIPSGYPRTESGVELRILEKLYTPEQAALTCGMRLRGESPERIAKRANMDVKRVSAMLPQMVHDGLVRAENGKDGSEYGLMPFVVGIYEMNLHRLDEELAALMEEYMQATGAENTIFQQPAVHRVIPVEQAIDFDLEVHTHERAVDLINEAQSWGVRDCICRVQKDLIGEGCEHPVEVCVTFSRRENAYDDVPATRPITRQEALDLLKQAQEAGLVHTTGNYRDGHHYICNCCTCSCGILRGVAEFKLPTAIAHSDFVATVDDALCIACEDCMDRCQFDAITFPDFVAAVDGTRCVGCGQCASVCTSEAMTMQRRARGEREKLPSNITTWMLHRARRRGPGLLKVL